jgi:hypothetical protein
MTPIERTSLRDIWRGDATNGLVKVLIGQTTEDGEIELPLWIDLLRPDSCPSDGKVSS